MVNRWGYNGNTESLYFLGSKITADGDCSHEMKRHLLLGRKAMTKLDSILKSRDITLLTKVCLMKVMVFPGVMYGCENWTMKKAEHLRIDAYIREDSWESLGLQGNPTSPSWRNSVLKFNGRADVEAEIPILWSPNEKNWLIWKDPAAGKDWRQEEKGTTKDEMVRWHHQLDSHEFEQAPGVGDGQGSLACCSPWSLKELDTTEWLNWTIPSEWE